MKTVLKWLAGLSVAFVLLVGIGTLLLKHLLPPEKARELIARQLTLKLHREVRLGNISIGLLTGLKAESLEISENPTFVQGTFVSAKALRLKIALLPLLSRQIVVKDLFLDHPIVKVVRYVDGTTYNFSDLLTAAPAPSTTTATVASIAPVTPSWARRGGFVQTAWAAGLPSPTASASQSASAVIISGASIAEGRVLFVDQTLGGQNAELSGIKATLNHLGSSGPTPFNIQLQLKRGAFEGVLKTSGEVDLQQERAMLATMEILAGTTKINLSGHMNSWSTPQRTLDMEGLASPLGMETLKALGFLPAALQATGPGVVQWKIAGNTQQYTVDATLDLTKAALTYKPTFIKPVDERFIVSYKGSIVDGNRAELRPLTITLGSLQTTLEGTVGNLEGPIRSIDLACKTNEARVSDLAKFLPGALPPSVARSNENLQSSARIRGGFGDTSKVLILDPLKLRLADISLEGRTTYRHVGVPETVEGQIHTEAFSVETVAKLVPSLLEYQPKGKARIDVVFSGSLAAPTVRGNLNADNISAKYDRVLLTQVSGPVQFTMQDVQTPKLTGQLNGGNFSLALKGQSLKTHPVISLNGTLDSLNLDTLLPPVGGTTPPVSWRPARWVEEAWAAPASSLPANPMDLSGVLLVGQLRHQFYEGKNVRLEWKMKDVTPDLSRMSGTADLKQGPGLLRNIRQLATVSKTAKVLFQPLVLLDDFQKKGLLGKVGSANLQSIALTALHGDYRFVPGTMQIKAFDLVGKDLELQSQGSVGLTGVQPLDVNVAMKLASGLLGGSLGQWLSDANGRVTVKLHTTGTVGSPKVQVDMQDATKKAVQQLGEGLLKGVLGGGANDKDGTPSEGTPQKPLKDLEKQLQNIFR